MFDILTNLLKDHKGDIVFNCFGIWHVLFIIIIFGLIILGVYLLKNRSQETKVKVINSLINIAFSLYILDFFLMPFAYGGIDLEKLPFHLCTISCVLCFLSRHTKFFYMYRLELALLGLVGNIIYVIYPAGVGWYQIAPYSYRVIQTLLFHSLMTAYGVFTLVYDEVTLDFKKCHRELIFIVLVTVWAMIGNLLYNSEARVYNWFFVIRDPFYILPIDISKYIMPFIMIIIVFIMDMLIYLSYFGIKKIIKKIK